jgi:trk system potassium uptake protein TrkA
MFVVIAGGGRTGTQLAKTLISINHKVNLIEYRKDILTRIHKEIPTESIFSGNPPGYKYLEQADIMHANVFAATTPSDADNLALCYLVREHYGVKRTIARWNNPRNAWLFDKKFRVDVAVNQADILSRLIEEEMSLGDMIDPAQTKKRQVFIGRGEGAAKCQGSWQTDQGIEITANCVISAVIRNGELVLPQGQPLLR